MKCCTCSFWRGDRSKLYRSLCFNKESPLFQHFTDPTGYCACWRKYEAAKT